MPVILIPAGELRSSLSCKSFKTIAVLLKAIMNPPKTADCRIKPYQCRRYEKTIQLVSTWRPPKNKKSLYICFILFSENSRPMLNINRMIPISASISISAVDSTNCKAVGPIITPVSKNPITGGIRNLERIRMITIAKNKISIISFNKIIIQFI